MLLSYLDEAESGKLECSRMDPRLAHAMECDYFCKMYEEGFDDRAEFCYGCKYYCKDNKVDRDAF